MKNYISIFMLCQVIVLSGCVTSDPKAYTTKAKICPSQLNFSIEELINIALVELDKRGEDSSSIIFSDVIIRQINCNIFVNISLKPDIIGNDFGVMISAENGKVLNISLGM